MIIDILILGSRAYKRQERSDKTLLTGYFLLMYIAIDIFFLAVNAFNPNGEDGPLYMGLGVSAVCLLLLRTGYINTAILVQLIRTNFIALYFTLTETGSTGAYLYFMSSGIGAMALYGHEGRWKGIGLSILSLILFLVSFMQWNEFSPGHDHFFMVTNFVITYGMVIIILYFLNQLTFLSKTNVIDKNIELEKVNSELDRFVYSVSHDLRAPLSSISGLIQLSEKSSNLEETRQYLELMKGRIERLEQFIRDIISFSRNARGEIRIENVNVKDLVSEIFETLKFVSGAENVVLEDALEDKLMIATDRTRLQIVLFNLISNAIQYRDPYKESFIRFSNKIADQMMVLTMEDNGIGIEEVHMSKVFNMFYRATENSKGSGLGLYIVRETMEKLGGGVSLASKFSMGTKFILTFPLQR